MPAGSILTKASLKKLCRKVSLSDLEIGCLAKTNPERLEWEQKMIAKYGFVVR